MSASADSIAGVPLFRHLPRKTLERIAAALEARTYVEGEAIVSEDMPGAGFYLVTEGAVEVTRRGTNLASIGPGGWFGEMALLDAHPRSATVRAAAPTTCYQLGRRPFLAELRDSPELAVDMLSAMSARLRELDARLASL